MKSRLWCTTVYDMSFDFQALYDKGGIKYLGYGEEVCPTTNRPHWQAFVLFQNARDSVKAVAKLFGNSHVEKCKGSLSQNVDYCSKEAELHHLGDPPRQGARHDVSECMSAVKEGVSELEIAESSPTLWCMYGRRFEAYRDLLQPKRAWKTEVRVFWGEAGSGKTKTAVEWLGDSYDDVTFTQGGFFIGYHNNENVLIDDFDYKSMPRDIFLKVTDRYQLTINVKGGERTWNPRRIAITSNKEPSEWYTWGDPYAIIRRLEENRKI